MADEPNPPDSQEDRPSTAAPPNSGTASGTQSQGQGPQGQGPRDAGPYGHAGYDPGPYGQGGYGPGPYGHAGYDPGPYGQGGYGPPPGYGQPGPGGGPYGSNAPYGYQPYGPQGPAGYYGAHQPPYGSYQPPPWPYSQPARQRTPEERRKRARRALTFAVVLVFAVGAGIGIGAAIAPTNPTTVARALVSNSVAAVKHAGSFHYSELSTTLGVPDNIIGIAAPHSGRQAISERCSSGTNVFDLRLVNGVVYFKGNDPAVVDQLGVSSATATSAVDKWVKISKGDNPYHSFEIGITTESNISQLTTTFLAVKSTQHSTTTKILGGLNNSGKAAGSATLVLATSSKLPRSFNADEVGTSGHLTLNWTFSHFGKKAHVSAPSSAVAFSSLHTKKPPKTVCG